MISKTLHTLLIFSILFLLGSCGEYQKVLKSTDNDYKFEMAKEYYEEENYARALPLLEELMNIYRGTPKAPQVYYYYAYTHFGEANYLLASFHFKNFAKTFKNDEHAEECAFMAAKCYYLNSPRYSLDQTNTYKALEELQLFINTHPGSERIEESNKLMADLRLKLEKKSFEKAKLFLQTENFKSAIIAFESTLNDFPDTKRKEEIYFHQLEAHYLLAEASVVSKQVERMKDAEKAYKKYISTFPSGEFKSEAEVLGKKINSRLEQVN